MKRPVAALGVASICISVALMTAVSWAVGPGVPDFNAFNERVFGRYYTAGAILMIGFYFVGAVAIAGAAATAAALSWLRHEQPRWVTWMATLAALAAPLVVLSQLRGA